jgi:BirA family biotin operon repressor/biotin-[acetyl-CoA-carboxylase] ligase
LFIRDTDIEDKLRIDELKKALNDSKIIGKNIIYFETLNSTNSYAMGLPEKECEDGTIIIANSQSAGRGRFNRSWVSPPNKNLYMSIVLKPDITLKDASILSLMAALSCVIALRKISTVEASIKWPNDIIINHRKLGGILIETRSENKKLSMAVVGIGINVNFRFYEMPDEIRKEATSLKEETGINYSRTDIALKTLKELDIWYDLFLRGGKEKIIKEWLRYSLTVGKHIKVRSGNSIYSGIAIGIDDEGRLLLKNGTNEIKISSGDVTVLR